MEHDVTPEISVVLPAYKNGRTIARTMESILQQDADFELIVADHGSTDDTWAVMERFASDPRVTLLRTEAGGGAARNWNRVTDAASGRFIKLVCGDDIVRPGTLSRQHALLAGDETAVLTACRRDIIDSSEKVLISGWGMRGISRPMPGTEAVRRSIRAGSNLFGEPACVMMRRDALTSVNGWCPDFPYLIDQATYSRVLLLGGFIPDLQVGAAFRMSDTQWSVALAGEQAQQARGFHHWMRAQRPDVVSALDVAVGDVRASLMSRARRLSYRILKRRMA